MPDSKKNVNDSENAKLFRTRMDIFVLNALDEKNGQGYGYDVIAYIQEHTKGHYKIKSVSTIYNILKRLEVAGYVSSSKGGSESYGAARVYYTLTPAGKEHLESYKREWKYIRTLLDSLVSDEEFDLENEEPPYSASELKPLTKRTRDTGSSSDEDDASEGSPSDSASDEVSEDETASSDEEKPSVDEISDEDAAKDAPSDDFDAEDEEEEDMTGITVTSMLDDDDDYAVRDEETEDVPYYDYTDDSPVGEESSENPSDAIENDEIGAEETDEVRTEEKDEETSDDEEAAAYAAEEEEEERATAVFLFPEADSGRTPPYDREVPDFVKRSAMEGYTPEERARHYAEARRAIFGTSADEETETAKGERPVESGYRPILPETPSSDESFPGMTVVSPASSVKKESTEADLKKKAMSYDDNADETAHLLLSPYIEKLKKDLNKEGYTLSTFSTAKRTNTVKYLFTNKILRDTSVASFFYLVVTLLVTYLFKNVFGVTSVSTFVIGGIGLLVPVAAFLICLRDPNRKKKDAVNIKLLISVLVLVYIVAFMAFVVYYLFTSKYTFLSPQLYAPAIILSTIPLSGVIFAVLRGSGKYTK